MIGRTLSHYVLEASLGKGGMGEVFGARDSRLGRAVAIKILPDDAARAGDGVRRFLTEAKAASALNHPNIVTVHEIDQADGVHFIVMEKIEGAPLSSIAGVPMPVDRLLDIALQTTSALAAAHRAGIIHRDIKPANIMLTTSGSVKVVDFGLARVAMPEPPLSSSAATAQIAESATKAGTLIGTIGYMSPEQVQGRRADARSDVFSLGVIFHTLLAGRLPFDTSTPLVAIASILRDEPARVDAIRNDVPAALADIVQRCLRKDPESRYADAAELHEALRTVQTRAERRSSPRRGRWLLAVAALLSVALIVGGVLWWRRESRVRWARDTAPRAVEQMLDRDPVGAYVLARRAMSIVPEDTVVRQTWTNVAFPVSVTTDPSGAEVLMRSYLKDDGDWVSLGHTPLENVHIPFPVPRFRFRLEGYATRDLVPDFEAPLVVVRMFRTSEVPAGMVAIPAGSTRFAGHQSDVPDFFIDRHEVTNAGFKRFIDAGGYRRRELWKHRFEHEGNTFSFEEAMARFVDRTGRPGPAAWELGSYAEGRDKHPVEAISWYEAAAFAEFSNKQLPTVFHWSRAAAIAIGLSDVLVKSNFASQSTVPVGSLDALDPWGTYDLAGNAEEWCLNSVGGRRYMLGASWTDPAYQFSEPDAAGPMERRAGIGLRLMQQNGPIPPALSAAIERRPIVPSTPVDDATFGFFRRLYDYDPVPLHARVEEVDDSHQAWRLERVSFTTAYSGERMAANLFLPKNAKPPYQAILYFPGSDAVAMRNSRRVWLRMVEFYVRSGRALLYPVYQGTYERQVPPSRGPNERRDLRIQRTKDARRAVDYLVSRSDIDPQRISFYGLSLGASMAPYILATEPRLKSAVLLAGGLGSSPSPPEAKQENFLPRVTLPVILLAGRYDFTFPAESSQRMFFELLGTPADRKKYVVFEGGHVPSDFPAAVREMLTWTDRWMGPVETK